MNKKILVLALLAAILVIGGPLALERYRIHKTSAWLDQKLVEWRPSAYRPMLFGAYDVYASDNMFAKTPAEIDNKMLDAIEEAGPDVVVLYIRPESYSAQKERYRGIMGKIRKDGKKLFIGARFDNEPTDINTYERALEEYTGTIIAEIRPEYYGIVIEPQTMERLYGFDAADEEWVGLSERIAALSKKLAPGTRTAVAGHTGELRFLRLASDAKDIDIIGFNIYGNAGTYPEYSGYLGKGDVVGESIDASNSKGKETWILETWTAAMITRMERDISVKERMKPVDAKWVRAMAYYAQMHNMAAVVPFYTGKFVYYGTNPAGFASALDKGARTPVFYSYKETISEARGATSG